MSFGEAKGGDLCSMSTNKFSYHLDEWAFYTSISCNFYEIFKVCVLFSLQNSGIEKAFLFDVVSKIYIATDSSPVDMQSYELCCDMIDVVIDVSCIYG